MSAYNAVLARNTPNAPVCPMSSQSVAFSHYTNFSAQLPIDPKSGKLVSGCVKEQARQCLDNIKAIACSIDHVMSDVVRLTVFVTSIRDLDAVCDVCKSYFPTYVPTLTTAVVAALPMGARVQIEALLSNGEGTIPNAPQAGDLIKLTNHTANAPASVLSSQAVAFSHYNYLSAQLPIDPKQGRVVPGGVEYAVKLGPWPYDVKKAKALLAEAGYPNGFETELWAAYNDTISQKAIQFIQQQLQQVGIKVTVQALEAGQRVERVESAPDPATAPVRMYFVGWSSSTGEADWALRPLLGGDSAPPSLYNMAYYNNPKVNEGLEQALITTDKAEKARIYKEVQETIWNEAPWAFLITAKSLYALSDKVSGMYLMPDASYFFEEIDLK